MSYLLWQIFYIKFYFVLILLIRTYVQSYIIFVVVIDIMSIFFVVIFTIVFSCNIFCLIGSWKSILMWSFLIVKSCALSDLIDNVNILLFCLMHFIIFESYMHEYFYKDLDMNNFSRALEIITVLLKTHL